MSDLPPTPPPVTCVVCGIEIDDWVWEEDPPPASWELDWEWWGKAFHCSRRCYIAGEEYRVKQQTS